MTDPQGRFEFRRLDPRHDDPVDPLIYLVFAEVPDRPIGVGGILGNDARPRGGPGNPVPPREDDVRGHGARPERQARRGGRGGAVGHRRRPVPGILSATTGPDGRFVIARIPHYDWLLPGSKDRSGLSFTVSHPDFPRTEFQVQELPRNASITLPAGCKVTGMVTDAVTGRPAAGAIVVAESLGKFSESRRLHRRLRAVRGGDPGGSLQLLGPGQGPRLCVHHGSGVPRRATLELPPLRLIGGGFIAGRVVNAKTGEPISVTAGGESIALGLLGPSQPPGKAISPTRLASVDGAGRFSIRAAPGENFPYLVNYQGDRMAWNTTAQPAVVVREGATTGYDMLVTPQVPRPRS